MKKINNGYADYYYLLKNGSIYNAKDDTTIKPNKEHSYTLRTSDNKRKKIALKTLYKLVYNEPYCIDRIKDLDDEQWKEVDDTEGLYYVSNKGRIKSLQGYEAIILKGFTNKNNYIRVDIIQGGERQTRLIHRLVAAAFLGMPEKLEMQLHHKDFNKHNNAADNLEWLTAVEHRKKHNERSLNNVSTKPEKDNDRKIK